MFWLGKLLKKPVDLEDFISKSREKNQRKADLELELLENSFILPNHYLIHVGVSNDETGYLNLKKYAQPQTILPSTNESLNFLGNDFFEPEHIYEPSLSSIKDEEVQRAMMRDLKNIDVMTEKAFKYASGVEERLLQEDFLVGINIKNQLFNNSTLFNKENYELLKKRH